jgi:hypothetical protein
MKNYIIALKISKNLLGSFWTIKTVAARLLHAPPRKSNGKQGGCNSLLPSSFPCRR